MGSFGYTSLHDHQSFEREADELKALGTAGTAGVAWDTQVRLQYQEAIRSVVERFRGQATSGHITWAQAAEKLQQARNDVMELIRRKDFLVFAWLKNHSVEITADPYRWYHFLGGRTWDDKTEIRNSRKTWVFSFFDNETFV